MSEEATTPVETEKEESLSSRLIAAMADMQNPTKSKTASIPTKNGNSYKYKYETLDQVLGVVRPALAEHGLALTQQQTWSENTSSYVLRTVVFDSDEERLMDERPLHDYPDAQAAGSWETYMRRYALRTAFGLAGEDDDGAATVGANRSAAQPRSTPNRANAKQGANKPPAAAKNRFAKVGELKAAVLDRGIKEEHIKEWLDAKFDGKQMKDFNDAEIKVVEVHLQSLIDSVDQLAAESEANNG